MLGVFVLAAAVSPILPYHAEKFRSLQESGKTVALQFTAEVCELCREQDEPLLELAADSDAATPVFMRAPVAQFPTLATLYDGKPSTVLIFRGKMLVGRETGISEKTALQAFITKSLMGSRARPKPRPKREPRPKR